VLGLKFAAYWLTGSIALYSDALESTINVLAAGAAFVALHVSARPADSNHPYGHHKAEYFSAVFEGVLVVVAAFLIFRSAYLGFLAPKSLEAPVVGLAINAERVSSMESGRGFCCPGAAAGNRRRLPRTDGMSWPTCLRRPV
jgi:cation diffusion facilitator family transporter